MFAGQSDFRRFVHSFIEDERGATAIEYALIAGGIFLAIFALIVNYASLIKGLFEMISRNVIPALV